MIPYRPRLSWRATPDGRREVFDGDRRTIYQIVDAHGPDRVGTHYRLAPPVDPRDPCYAYTRDALDALADFLLSQQTKAVR